jgi:hypothetical protein
MFQDFTTLLLAIYVGCHLYMTVSSFVSKTYKSIMTKVDNVTEDFHTIAMSISRVSLAFDTANRSNESARNQVLYMFYGMFFVLLTTIFRIDLSSFFSSLVPVLSRLVSAYVRGGMQNGNNDQYGLNEEMRTILMQTLMQTMTGETGRVPVRPSSALPTRFGVIERNNNADSDTESDITEIVIENTENVARVPVNSPVQEDQENNQNENNNSRDGRLNSLGSGNLSELSNLVVINGNVETTY